MTGYRISRRIRLLKLWKRLWEEKPDEMTATRIRATKAAQDTYRNRNSKLRLYVVDWPVVMTNEDLRNRCVDRAGEFGFKPRSVKTKLKRLGLIAYDPVRRLWTRPVNNPLDAKPVNDCIRDA